MVIQQHIYRERVYPDFHRLWVRPVHIISLKTESVYEANVAMSFLIQSRVKISLTREAWIRVTKTVVTSVCGWFPDLERKEILLLDKLVSIEK